MKTSLLSTCAAVLLAIGLSAQTKGGAEAMQMQAGPVQPNNNPTIQSFQPPVSSQAIYGYYQQDFESTTFPPTGWRVENINGPTYTWARSTAQAHNSTASAFIRYDAIAGGGLDWMITPHFHVSAVSDSLVFWLRMAFTGYPPDSLCIKVSTSDSASTSFGTTLLKLVQGTAVPPMTLAYPTNTTTWYRYAVSLQNYVGQSIYLGFKHYNVDGNGLYIDDVSIGTRPAAEVGTTAMASPGVSEGAGPVTPQGTVYNFGTAAQTFNVTTTINPGGYTSTTSVSALASGASAPVTFAAWNATPGTYTVKMFTELPGDANVANDTLTRIVTVYPAFNNYGWTNSTVLPAGRWATAPVFVDICNSGNDSGYVFLISGADATFANTTLNTRYNVETGVYTNMAPIPQSRTQITPVHVNGKIYVIGGYGGSFAPVTTNSIYDIATDTWTTGAPLVQQVGDYAIGVYNDSLIYVVGGYTGSGDVNLVQIYDTYTNTWSPGTVKPGTAVAGCRMGITGNQIVFMGGYSQTLAATQSLAYLGAINPAAPGTITWTTLPNYPAGPAGRHGSGTSLENDGLVYFGGGDPNGQGLQVMNACWAYNTILSQWEIGPNMLGGVSNISGFAGATRNDSLFMVTMGGYNGTAVVTNHAWLNLGQGMMPYAQTSAAVCAGNSVMIHGYDALTYAWSPAATLSNPNIDMPMAMPAVTTTYTVTMDRGYGCLVVDSTVVTVNALPTVTASANDSTVCMGDSVTVMGGGATSYAWSGGVTDNVAFAAMATDTYTVTGTDANGCTNTSSVMITVNALPNVTASSTTSAVCDGDSVTVMGGGATSYAWSGGVMDNVAFVPVMTDTYTVTGTDANGCEDTATVMVTVNANPVVTVSLPMDTACTTIGSITLSGESPAGGTWSGTNVTGNSFDPSTAPLGYNVITYQYTDANGCEGMTTDSIWVDLCTDIADYANSNGVAIYPNPNSGQFNILLAAAPANAVTVEIMNELGQTVAAFTLTATQTEVNMNSYDNGIYFVRVINGDAVSVTRFVKQ